MILLEFFVEATRAHHPKTTLQIQVWALQNTRTYGHIFLCALSFYPAALVFGPWFVGNEHSLFCFICLCMWQLLKWREEDMQETRRLAIYTSYDVALLGMHLYRHGRAGAALAPWTSTGIASASL